MRSHEIDYEIKGHDVQFVEVELDPRETVIAEAGAMLYMEEGIQFEMLTNPIEIIIEPGMVDKVIETIQTAANTGKIGDGKIFVLPMPDAVRVRTNERGAKSIQ